MFCKVYYFFFFPFYSPLFSCFFHRELHALKLCFDHEKLLLCIKWQLKAGACFPEIVFFMSYKLVLTTFLQENFSGGGWKGNRYEDGLLGEFFIFLIRERDERFCSNESDEDKQ